jgi:hypothetical protein
MEAETQPPYSEAAKEATVAGRSRVSIANPHNNVQEKTCFTSLRTSIFSSLGTKLPADGSEGLINIGYVSRQLQW